MKRKSVFRFFDRYFGIPILIILTILLKRKRRLPIENIRKIAVIKLAAIGDSILIVPLIKALRRNFPECEISFICSDINIEIINKIPYINRTILCNVHSFYNPVKFFKFILPLRKENFDVMIDAGQWERINSIITALINCKFSVGFKTARQLKHFIYDRVVIHFRDKHELENFFDLLSVLGIGITKEDKQLEYFLTDENKKFAENFWINNNLNNKTVICFHPGCGGKGKPREWDTENYINLGKRIMNYNPDIVLILTGPREDEKRNKQIEKGISGNVINITGSYTLDEVVAIVERVKLIVCSNTGMLHLASCVKTKTLGLHGPTNPVKWGAYDTNSVLIQSDKFCSPCLYLGHDYGCKKPTCMAHISVDDVFIYIRKALNPELFNINY